MTEALGAEKGERVAGRQGYRSGYYGRTLITRVGKLELRVPQGSQRAVFDRAVRTVSAVGAGAGSGAGGDVLERAFLDHLYNRNLRLPDFAQYTPAADVFLQPDFYSELLWNYLAADEDRSPRRIGTGPYPESVFYASTGTYNLSHTCNTWTAEALRVTGLPVTATGVVFAGQVLDELPPLLESNNKH
jgi:hypothetical protein